EVDAERLENLRLDEMPDARVGHDRNGHGLLVLLDLFHARHERHAAVAAAVPGRAPHRPDGCRARAVGNLRLLRMDDVQDGAAPAASRAVRTHPPARST